MARLPKRGLDYAPWDVRWMSSPEIDKLADAQGGDGILIYHFLCMCAYEHEGYYYEWSYDVAPTTARRLGLGIRSETVKSTVATCLRIGLFDERLFAENGVLTSRGIQRRYAEAIQKRSYRTVNKSLWLLDDEESKGFGIICKNSDFLPENADFLPENADFLPENGTKVKERKVKESKGKKSSSAHEAHTPRLTASDIVREKEFSDDLEAAVLDWVKYKSEKRQNYKETGLRALLSQIENKAAEFGEEAVVNVIRLSMSNNWQGIIWDRIIRNHQDRNTGNPYMEAIQNRVSDVDSWI